MSIQIDLHPIAHPMSAAERAERMKNLGFGRFFTEHMVIAQYRDGAWNQARLEPYAPVTLDPAASVLHYGQAIFEGYKAYRQKDGGACTFRPERNAQRFARSAERLAMPPLPPELFLAAGDALIRHERAWVPTEVGHSLYIRPLMISTEPALGVRPSNSYTFIVFGSPSASYFAQGVKPVTVWISEDYSRAAPGGTGAAKCAGNYAASLIAQKQARERGCDQVVWTDACEHRHVEEMGGMNIFFVYQKGDRTTLVTPKLTGSLLPGVTRDSLLVLGKDLGYETEERLITVEDWGRALESGDMTEAFACGTAAVITPIGNVQSRHGEWRIHGGEPGPVATRLRRALLEIQHGLAEDKHGWLHRVC
jgi:branched-chain amino acid aminotransferase